MPKATPKSKLGKSLKETGAKEPKKREAVWRGPEVDGVTQSLLSRFLVCRERFRLLVIEGLKPPEGFNKAIEYGNMWHLCEETNDAGEDWQKELMEYCQELCRSFPIDQVQIEKWYNVCKVQFPVYLDFWKKHETIKNRESLLQEEYFKVPYTLPSGRTVILKGKMDGVELIGKGKKAGIYLKEHKSKGDINEEQLQKQLTFDMQTMIYLIALQIMIDQESALETEGGGEGLFPKASVKGVVYNVVRRPLSGGKGSIRPHKGTAKKQAETMEHFYNRLKEDYIEADPEYWFMRWKVEITKTDIERFKTEFLNPILEQLCDWWACINGGQVSPCSSDYQSFRLPFGVYNPLLEGRSTDVDNYLLTGSTVGLERTKNLFPEL